MVTAQMLEHRLDALEQQVARDRRRLSRMRLLCCALVMAVVGTITLAAANRRPVDEVIQAKRLEVVDDNGSLIAALGIGDDGHGQIDLWTSGGKNILRLGANRHGGDINLWNIEGAAVFGAYASRTGAESGVWTRGGSRVVQIASTETGGSVTVSDAASKPSIVAAAGPSGGRLQVLNGAGRPVVEQEAGNGGGHLRVNRDDGKVALEGRVADDGTGLLAVADVLGQVRGQFGVRHQSGFVQLHNAGGQPVIRAGALSESAGGFLTVGNDQGIGVVRVVANESGCGRLDLSNEVGNSVYFVDGVKDVGSLMALISAGGQRMFVVGTTEAGGLMNLINASGVSNVIVGTAEDGRGGAVSVRNGRGIEVFQAGTGVDEHGRVLIRSSDGERDREIVPGR